METKYPYRGFGWFLSNSFISLARTQLLNAIVKLGLLSFDEAKAALEAAQNCQNIKNSLCNQ